MEAIAERVRNFQKFLSQSIDKLDILTCFHFGNPRGIMKKFSSMVCAAFLVGCGDGSINYLYSEGMGYAERDSIITRCDVYAAQQVPANVQTRTTPSYTTPVQTQCTNIGGFINCQSHGGNTIGGNIISEDVNAPLRTRLTNQCYAQNGLGLYNFKPCTEEQIKSYTPSNRLPKLTQDTCYVTLQGNRVAFHTPS